MGERLEKLVIFNEGTLKKGGLNGAPPPNYKPPKPKSFSHPKLPGSRSAGADGKPKGMG